MNSAVRTCLTVQRPVFEREILLKSNARPARHRAPQGKRLIIRGNSMLPQFKIAPEVLQMLVAASHGQTLKRRLIGVLAGRKSTPQHFLSIKITDLTWAGRSESTLGEDYHIRLLPGIDAVTSSDLEAEYFKAQRAVEALDCRIEPLHVCRAVCGFDVDQRRQRVTLKTYLVFPSVSLQFTPVEAGVVTGARSEAGFALGFLVQDGSKIRAISRKEAVSATQSLLGLWATGVPAGNQPSEYPFLHPLIWAAAVQFLQTHHCKTLSDSWNSFLFVYQNKHFYEVSACVTAIQSEKNMGWQTALVAKTLEVTTPGLITFFPDDLVEEESTRSSSSFSTPVRQISNFSSWDKNSDVDPQMKIRLLEQQVSELQRQLRSAAQSLCSTPAMSPIGGKTGRSRKTMEETGKCRNSALNLSGVLFKVDEFEEVGVEIQSKIPQNCSPSGISASPPSQKEETHISFLRLTAATEESETEKTFLETDTSYQIPKITYESDESSEDDSFSIANIQQKYLICPQRSHNSLQYVWR